MSDLLNDRNDATLTADQKKKAAKIEKRIEIGISSYVDIGLALEAIRSEKLYEGSFATYVVERFELRRHAAYRTIRAALVADRLRKAGLPMPRNEGQAHLLHEQVPESDQVEVWQAILDDHPRPTISAIRGFVTGMRTDVESNLDPGRTRGAGLPLDLAELGAEATVSPARIGSSTFPTGVQLFDYDKAMGEVVDSLYKVLDDVHRVEDKARLLQHVELAESVLQQIREAIDGGEGTAA